MFFDEESMEKQQNTLDPTTSLLPRHSEITPNIGKKVPGSLAAQTAAQIAKS